MSINVMNEEGDVVARVVLEQPCFPSGSPLVAISLGVGAVQSTLLSPHEAKALAEALLAVAH